MAEQSLALRNDREAQALFGKHDQHLRRIEQVLGVTIVSRGEELKISGEPAAVSTALRLFDDLLVPIRAGAPIRKDDVEYALKALADPQLIQLRQIYQERIEVPSKRRFILPRTPGQKLYVDAMRHHDVVFAIGPAGTGKSFLAMAMAVEQLTKGEVSRIILVRPAVEAGEKLGFLPGDLQEKIDPYLRPLYDALYDMMEVDTIQRYFSRGLIEVAPLAYMRGRTLNEAFIVLDEAQNSTTEQMKMFLTRLGYDSKAVITGDVTQVDLPSDRMSGLIHVQNILHDVPGLKFVSFSGEDVVRHELVQAIIRAYDAAEKPARGRPGSAPSPS
ncbi:MAG: PhoH family protein [Candidatus Omnitrophica bacterium]|nr:PhoH family protein [Candidatus Omnitrophota bacterium]